MSPTLYVNLFVVTVLPSGIARIEFSEQVATFDDLGREIGKVTVPGTSVAMSLSDAEALQSVLTDVIARHKQKAPESPPGPSSFN